MRLRLLISATWPYALVLLVLFAIILYSLAGRWLDWRNGIPAARSLRVLITHRSLYALILIVYWSSRLFPAPSFAHGCAGPSSMTASPAASAAT
jgi:hypothetical protein